MLDRHVGEDNLDEVVQIVRSAAKLLHRLRCPGCAESGGGLINCAAVVPGGTDVAVVDGGTGASTAAGARTNLGLAIGTDVQAFSTNLTSWAAITRAAGFDTFVATPSSANLRALLSDEVGTGAAYFVGGALGTPASGTATNLTGLPLSTGVTGTLGIGNGGTGQTTAAAAFDALSPTTTRGDLIFRNATTNTRLAASTAGYLLQANGAGTDPTYAGFLQAGTGAVTRTWRAKGLDIVSVKDFGALGDNSTNDTAAIVAAIAAVSAAGGGFVFFPVGIYRVTSLGNIPANVALLGAGRAVSKIRTTSATLDVISLDGANAHVLDLGIDATVTRSAGSFIKVTTNASTLDIHRVNMVGAFRGITIPNVALANLSHVDILDTVDATGVSIDVSDGFALILDNVICRQSGATHPFAHLNITNVQDCMVSNSQFIGAASNLNMAPGNGQAIGLFKSVNTQYDDASGPSVRIAPTGTGKVNEVVIDAPWIKGVGQDVLITNAGGGTVNSVDVMNALMTGTGNGVEALGVGNIGVFNCKIGGHTTGVSFTDVAKGRIIGNVLAAHGLYAVNTTGLVLAGTTDGVVVEGNNLTSTTPVTYSASGTKNRLVNNHGYNDTLATAALTVGASPATIATKPYPRTVYINAGTVSLVTVNGANMLQSSNHAVHLGPNHTLVVTYSVLPTLVEAIC